LLPLRQTLQAPGSLCGLAFSLLMVVVVLLLLLPPPPPLDEPTS
jgi:hypothetical protein